MDRYSRQRLLPFIGDEGQQRLSKAKVLIVGVGATGSVLADQLVRAGVGMLTVVDRDVVERSNLQRQTLYDEEDAAQSTPKAVAAERRLRRINSEIRVEGIVADFHGEEAEDLVATHDLTLDGTDNFEARYVINDAAVKHRKPWIYVGAVSTYGMTAVIVPEQSACLRCLIPEPPAAGSAATCDTAGVLGPAVGAIASVAAAEAIKLLVGGAEESLTGRIAHFDLSDLTWRLVETRRKAECPCCVHRQFPFLEDQAGIRAVTLCGRNTVQVLPGGAMRIDLEALAQRLRGLGEVKKDRHSLRISIDEYVLTVFPDGRALVQGTVETGIAKSIYSRYVGS
jgi:molybdopterin-synthase adenylyltransferase